jgi:hypothetical protein
LVLGGVLNLVYAAASSAHCPMARERTSASHAQARRRGSVDRHSAIPLVLDRDGNQIVVSGCDRGTGLLSKQMANHRHGSGERESYCMRRQPIDESLLARAAEINESVASEFTERGAYPPENPLLTRMADLGIDADAAVSVALQRAHRIEFHMRRGRTPRDAEEVSDAACGLSSDERAHVASLAVAWWDGALTALRARELERHDHR